jgi:hypothetical protein
MDVVMGEVTSWAIENRTYTYLQMDKSNSAIKQVARGRTLHLSIAIVTQNSICQAKLVVGNRVLHVLIVTMHDRHEPCLF